MINGILQKNEIKNKSIEVKEEDIPFVLEEAEKMKWLCFEPVGVHTTGAIALAHCQIEKDKPLRFFVFKDGECIINPVILFGSAVIAKHFEGCLSIAFKKEFRVKRYALPTVEYWKIRKGKFKKHKETLTGLRACVFQHEIDHFDNLYVDRFKCK